MRPRVPIHAYIDGVRTEIGFIEYAGTAWSSDYTSVGFTINTIVEHEAYAKCINKHGWRNLDTICEITLDIPKKNP